MPDADKYAAERYNPTLAHCHSSSLLFDGSNLSLFASNKLIRTYRVVSGTPTGAKQGTNEPIFEYSQTRQKQAA